jgi:hypothetical protein
LSRWYSSWPLELFCRRRTFARVDGPAGKKKERGARERKKKATMRGVSLARTAPSENACGGQEAETFEQILSSWIRRLARAGR